MLSVMKLSRKAKREVTMGVGEGVGRSVVAG